MPITSTLTKAQTSPIRCDSTDANIQEWVEKTGLSDPNAHYPVAKAVEILGLSNGLVALSNCDPKYRKQSVAIQEKYLALIYTYGINAAKRFNIDAVCQPQWLCDPNRKVTCLAHMRIWQDVAAAAATKGIEYLARSLATIYNADQDTILRAVYGTKHLLAAHLLLDGPTEATKAQGILTSFLLEEINRVD